MAQEEKKEELVAKPTRPDHVMKCDNYIDGEFVPPSVWSSSVNFEGSLLI